MLQVKRELRRTKLFEIQKLTKRARALEAKRGSETQVLKNKRKAQRCLEELEHIKEFDLSELAAEALKGGVAVNSKPPDDLRERARWRLLSSRSLKGVVSKVQLNRAKNLVRGYKTAAGSVGSGDARGGNGSGSDAGEGSVIADAAVDDGEGSDDGSVDHVRGSDDDGGGGGYDSGGGDSGEEGADDDGALSCDDIGLDSSTDGLGASEIQQAGRLALHSSEESDQDDYQTSVTAASSNSTGGKLSRTKKLMLTAPKTKRVGSGADKKQGQKLAGRKTIAVKDGSSSGRRPKANSLFVSTLRERRTQKQRSKKLSAHKKSNRLGQRARRRMWEDLHGTSAKHLINQSAEGKTVKGGIRKTHRPASHPAKSKIETVKASNLHPSWEASKRRKQQETGIAEFKGQRIVFSET